MIKDWKNKPQSVDMIRGKKVAVLGLGVEGLASARYFVTKKAEVTVLDEKEEKDIDRYILQEIQKIGVKMVFGKDAFTNLALYGMLIRSPGIRRFTSLLDDAAKKGVEVTSQTSLFFDFCPCPIIGVTGTKGKGTTASLIYEMLKKSDKDLPAGRQGVYLGGNIGRPPFEFLDILNPQSIVVLELSSYQLQDLKKSPHIAVMLMVTSEHLIPDRAGSVQNYHPDINDYVQAKRNIVRFQTQNDFAILNRDYPAVNESDILIDAKIYYVSRERVVEDGCYIKDAAVWLRMNGGGKKVIDKKDILLPGKHNLENVCAATMAATLAGVSKENIVKVLKTFKGLEHRLELVREVGGVKYYDDSFSTTPETAIAAIEAFKESDPSIVLRQAQDNGSGQVVLILGGSSKKSDFGELGRVIAKTKNIRAIIGVGEEWRKIKFSIFNFQFSNSKKRKLPFLLIEGAKDMSTIVSAASKIAKSGDIVLLSPACASFGMFKNYKDRGEQFKREVMRIRR